MKPTANIRLRKAIKTAGLTYDDVAHEAKVSVKTAQRWVYEGRTPRLHRAKKIAACLGAELFWLWPNLSEHRLRDSEGAQDRCELYSRASAIPSTFLLHVMQSAERELCVLTDSPRLLARLEIPRQVLSADRANVGVTQRLLVPAALATSGLTSLLGVDVRTHRSVRGSSVIRADDAMIVVPAGLGLDAISSPALFLTRTVDHGPFDRFVEGFERLWRSAQRPGAARC